MDAGEARAFCKMSRFARIAYWFVFMNYYWTTVAASSGTLAKEFCRRESLDFEGDAQAVITTVFAIREPVTVRLNDQKQQGNSLRGSQRLSADYRRKLTEVDATQEPSGRSGKSCGSVTQRGLQCLVAVDWVTNILNLRSEDVYGIAVNDSFIPGVKIGFRTYDTCGLEGVPVSQLIEAYSDFYAPSQSCVLNASMINAGAIVGDIVEDDLADAAAYMKRYSQPLMVQSSLVEPLTDASRYENVFSTSPSITAKAQAMINVGRQLGWSHVALMMEDNAYGEEGKRQLLRAAKDHELCISDFYKIPTIPAASDASYSTNRSQLENVLSLLAANLPHAPAVFVFASESTSVEFLQALLNSTYVGQASQLRWILSDFIKESARFANMFPARGLFALAPDSPADLPEFREYWTSTSVRDSNNGWLKEYYQQTLGCRSPDNYNPNFASLPVCADEATYTLGDADADIVINPTVISIIDSIYAFAIALKRAWESKCRGRPGLCPQLLQMSHEDYLAIIRNTEFKYDHTVRAPPSLVGRHVNFRATDAASLAVYELVEREGQLLFMEVFMFQEGRLRATGQPIFYYFDGSVTTDPPASICQSADCSCVSSNQPPQNRPLYKEGDLVLAAVFPIHAASQENGVSTHFCGLIRQRDGYQLAEAFWYALDKVNEKRAAFASVLRGVRLGSLALDSCNSPPRASHLASGLVIDADLLESTEADESKRYHSRDIIGVIGDYGDQTSAELASVLRFAGLSQLAYGAKSAELGDPYHYPYLLRTVVSDNTRLNMTFSALRQLGRDYVQVVHSESNYGRTMNKVFRAEAVDAGVCVAQSLALSSNSSNAADVVEGLLQKPNADVVILFLEKRGIRALLEQLQRLYSSSTDHRFVLIAPDHWYNDPEMVKGVEAAAEGALAFAARRLANQHFHKHISGRSIRDKASNPWLTEYVESSLHCNFPGSSSRQYSASCNPTATLGQIPGFKVDLASNDVINAVYAFAFGLDAMLKTYCGKDYEGICAAFKALPNRSAVLYEFVRRTAFEDETARVFAFSEHGDAATPVAVLHVRKTTDGLQYAQAGLYAAAEALTRPSFIQASVVRALRGRTVSNCAANATSNCAECRRFLMTRADDHSATSPGPFAPPPTAVSLFGRSRSDRNSVVQASESGLYSKQFLYSPSPDKVIMGAILPIHGHGGGSSSFQCDQLNEEGVFMAEAFLWALDAMNSNTDVVRFQSGALVIDSCSNAGDAFEDLKDLYTKPVGYFITNGSEVVNPDDVIAFVGDPTEDGVCSLASDLLSSMNVTSFGVGSVMSAFTDEVGSSPYSLYTTSQISAHNAALLSLMEYMNWTYASVVYSRHRWGAQAYFRFKSEALDRGLCFGAEISIPAENSPAAYDKVVSGLKSKLSPALSSTEEGEGARVVILLLDTEETSAFLRSVGNSIANGQLGAGNGFVFVGAATWGDRIPFREGEERAFLGSIVFQHDSQPVDAFATYATSLRHDNNDRNPWWREFWRRKFKCETEEDCGKYSLSESDFRNEALYTNIMNAVWAASVGLNNLCTSGAKRRQQQSPCREIQKSKNFRARFLQSVRDGGFARIDNPQESFRFTKSGWSESGFYVLNLVHDESGDLEYKAVGRYTEKSGLTLTDTMSGYDGTNTRVPLNEFKSRCTDPKMCPQCAKLWRDRESNNSTISASASPATSTTVTTLLQTQPSSSSASGATGTIVPTYSVSLSNATYTDAFLYAAGSADSYLIVVTFPVHARGARPLSCGRLRPEHYQNLQAFLWALKVVHADSALSLGAKLGALVFDTCSDSTKAVRDLSNFLSEQVIFRTANGEKIDPARTLAVLNSPYMGEALPIAELLSSYGVPNISPGMSASMLTLSDTYKARMTLRTSVPTDVQARAMAALLTRIGWNTVSVLFTDNVWGLNGQTDFRTESDHRDICVVISETVPESEESNCTDFAPKVDETVARLLAAKAAAGVRGVVAWLTEESLRCFLFSVKRAIDRGLMKAGDLNLILPADVADLYSTVIDDFEREALGFVAFQYAASTVEPFREYWQTLPASDDVAGHFWSKEYHERSPQAANAYHQNAYLLNTINAVVSIAVGLEQLRRNVCSEAGESSGGGLCPKLLNNTQFRNLLLDSIRKVDFEDVTGKRFQFVHNSSGNEALAISNLVRKQGATELRQIGYYENEHLKLRLPPQGFDEPHQAAFNLRDSPPACGNGGGHICEICKSRRAAVNSTPGSGAEENDPLSSPIPETTTPTPGTAAATVDLWRSLTEEQQRTQNVTNQVAESPVASAQGSPIPVAPPAPVVVGSARLAKDLVVSPPSRRFTILGLFPVHRRGRTPLSCEGFNALSGFQRLAAFLYAVNEVNRDRYLLPGIELGAVAFDDCSSQERALADVFEFLSSPDGAVTVDDLVAAVGFDYGNGGAEADRFFRHLDVPIVSAVPTPLALREETLTLGTVPADDVYAKIVAEVFSQMKWTYFSVLYETSSIFEPTAKFFERSLTANRAGCSARSVSLRPDASLEETQLAARQLVLATGSKAVALFLSDRNTLQLLKAIVAEDVPVGRFVFVTKFNDDWTQDADFLVPLERFGQGLVTIELQRRNSTNFANFLSSLTLQNHAPFPTAWFKDFWQQTFQCVLSDASAPRQLFSTPCTGGERLTADSFVQSATALPTILAVQTVARGLHRFLMQNCPSSVANTLEACVAASPQPVEEPRPRSQLMKAIRATNFTYAYAVRQEPVWVSYGASSFLDADYSVRNLIRESDGNFRAQEVGVWRPTTGLMLDSNQIVLYDGRGERKTPTSTCAGESCATQCAASSSASVALASSSPFPESKPQPRSGPSASLYFNSVWGVVVAVVAGLGMLTCVVCIIYFLVMFPISHGTTVLGYMILFGLIVLYALAFAYVVAPTAFSCSIRRFCTGICWAFVFAPMLIKVSETSYCRGLVLTRLALGVVCVQIVIAIEWVILQSPDGVTFVTMYRGEPIQSPNGGVWRCGPGEQFETVVVISTVYVMFLLFLTMVFSLVTWNVDEHNRESRWIFLASTTSVAVWLAWTLLATRHEYKIRDPAIAIGIVVNATIILLCLYVRKAYLYNKYRREAKEVIFDNQSAVYLTSTLASGGQLMMETGAFYDGKIIAAANGNHYIGVQSSSASAQAPANGTRRPYMPPPSTPVGVGVNGRRSVTETRTVLYSNAAFEAGGCEFNPGARLSATNGAGLYNGKTNGSLMPSTPTNHRF